LLGFGNNAAVDVGGRYCCCYYYYYYYYCHWYCHYYSLHLVIVEIQWIQKKQILCVPDLWEKNL